MNYIISWFSFSLPKTDKIQRNIMHTAAQNLPLDTVWITYYFDQGDSNTSVSIKSITSHRIQIVDFEHYLMPRPLTD